MKTHFPAPDALKTWQDYRQDACHNLQKIVARLRSSTPKSVPVSREVAIALTHLETAMLWLDSGTDAGGVPE